MAKFLIEVPHEAETVACARAVKLLLNTGSHFMTHADFGCFDGVHKAWITVEAGDRDEARAILPPTFRAGATIVQLNRFTIEELDKYISHHD